MDGSGVTSLATNGELATCPRRVGWFMLSLSTGQTVPARCDANSCPYCAPIKASLIARALALAEPQRAVRFSKVPNDWKRAQRAIKRTTELLRAEGFQWRWAYHIEPNPRQVDERSNHLHGWQHGDYVPQRALQEICRRSGLGIPYIERVKQQTGRGGSVGYGLKGLRYGMKHDDLDTFLDLNGGRLVHASYGFWRDGSDGERLTLESAKDRARRDGEDDGPWVLRRTEAA